MHLLCPKVQFVCQNVYRLPKHDSAQTGCSGPCGSIMLYSTSNRMCKACTPSKDL